MKLRALVLSLAVILGGGCRKATPETPAEAAIKKLVEFRDRACGCLEQKCVRLAQKELADWMLHNAESLGAIKFTPAQDKAGQQASAEMDACVKKSEQSMK